MLFTEIFKFIILCNYISSSFTSYNFQLCFSAHKSYDGYIFLVDCKSCPLVQLLFLQLHPLHHCFLSHRKIAPFSFGIQPLIFHPHVLRILHRTSCCFLEQSNLNLLTEKNQMSGCRDIYTTVTTFSISNVKQNIFTAIMKSLEQLF